MCWITGFISNIENKEKILKSMTDKITHRWPNDEWFFIKNNIVLWHRRLSIIDLEWWHQPIIKSWYTIVFNWEIYNYKEIREELEKLWYSFETNSDTEVLLTWYIEFKEKILEKLNWMFAFVIYSEKENNIFFVRDRLWIKPFYYFYNWNDFIFWSEIKTILEFPWIKKELNTWVLNSYFQYRYILWEETFFKWIKKLLPGNYWYFGLNTKEIEVKKYWDLKLEENKIDLWEEYYVENTEKLLKKSVKRRMIADVKVWAYLSWWLDSSLVSSMMQKVSSKPINTYTIWFKEDWFNEFEWSRLVAKNIWANHHEILLSWENYLETMDYLIEYKDAPLSVPNEVPLYLMSKELKKDITVVLSWEWADELFGWYGRIFKLYIETLRNNSNFEENFIKRYNYVSDESLFKFLSKNILEDIDKKSYTNKIFKEYLSKVENLKIEDKIPYIFEKLHLPWLLERVDVTTMATSVEARVPFVDHELVEFVNSIPFKYKIKWKDWYDNEKAVNELLKAKDISEKLDTTKYILRKVSEKYLPKEIIERKKVWFPVPLDNWFKWNFQEYAKKILLDDLTLSRWIFDKDYLLSKKWTEELNWINIWMMINLELFIRKYFD